jgi:two-component system CheB/CheR fusion protein
MEIAPALSTIPAEGASLSPSEHALDFLVIGIGASAGGIPALLTFFENMPADAEMAFVLILHLSPTHDSRADEVLQRVTKMPIMQVVAPTQIERNHIYLISPANDITIRDGYLHASVDDRPRGRPVAIDLFFRSLADAQGSRAISIILSGTGSDGALGIARIKEQAGVTIVQTPDDAEYPEMSLNAIATGSVDIVLPVAEIPGKLIELWANARAITLPPVEDEGPDRSAHDANDLTAQAEHALREVLDLLRARTGHDFHHYKRATVLRRVERRLQVNALPDLPSYKSFFERFPDETSALLKDMLIGVTNFFRDPLAFDALEQNVLQKIVVGKTSGQRLRVWIAGCSTGEEAYSLGMILAELTEQSATSPTIQLFASDIDEHAIKVARSGSYPDSILTDVAQGRIDRFFNKLPGRYVVNNSLREKVLYAKHNVLRDPPFSQLDLVSCRNLLIYLDRSVQREVLETFHFALQPAGYLFLGTSESAEIASDLFTPIDKKNRIFKVNELGTRRRPIPQLLSFNAVAPVVNSRNESSKVTQSNSFGILHQRILEHHAPPSLIVDQDAKILHTSADVGRYLTHVAGEPSQNLLTLINPQLRLELRAALFQAHKHGGVVEVEAIRFSYNEAWSFVSMSVRPFQDVEAGIDATLVMFEERAELVPVTVRLEPALDSTTVTRLESELHQTKEQLQSTIEHANVSTEELKASNEELQAINEELWSTTEELETSKEELQSVNEELSTVNAELHLKVDETTKAVDDLGNLIASTGIATVFVDRAMRIKRYTAPAVGLFNLINSDIGRPLLDITHRLDYPQLASDATASFETLKVIEREVSAEDGRWFLARLLPYRTSDDHIDGAVLTLIDITARRSAEHDARSSDDRLKLAALTTDDYAIIVQSLDGVIVSWNKGAKRVFGYDETEVLGQPIDVIFLPEDRAARAPLLERERATQLGRAEDGRWHLRRDGTTIYCSGVTTPLNVPSFSGYGKILRDLTEQQNAESRQQLQLSAEQAVRAEAEASLRLRDEFFAVLSHELKNPLNLIHVKAELLARAPEVRNITVVQDAAEAIQRSVIGQAKIIDDLLDLSRVRTGKLNLQLLYIDIALIMRTVVDASLSDAAASDITISLSGTENALFIQADAVRFEQMLWNLVRNALKFTSKGGTVALSLSHLDKWACIAVTDTGRGIAAEYLPKIFDMFSQAEGGERRDHGGLGIGLSLVKQLAEMHGGRVEVESNGLGQGACFRLLLPESSPTIEAEMPLPIASSTHLLNKRILLVDDSLDTLESFQALLECEGAQVHAESNAEAALQAATEQDFDFIFSDIGMPKVSGYEFIARVRNSDRNSTVVAIALTGFGRTQDAAHAISAGFDAHLGKPFSLSALIDAIDSIAPRRVAPK